MGVTSDRGVKLGGCAVLLASVLALAISGTSEANHDLFNRVSTGEINGNGDNISGFKQVSADGSRVFFETNEQLVPGDTDVFVDVYERSGGVTMKISPGSTANNALFDDASADGSRVVFSTPARLAPTDNDPYFDLYERADGVTTHVSQGEVNGNGDFVILFQGAAADGSRIFFVTAEALVAADADTTIDVYERSDGTTKLVSAGTSGNGDFGSVFGGAAADGSVVAFSTREQLVPEDDDEAIDAYQRSGATTSLVSRGPSNGNGAFDVGLRRVSASGTHVFFETDERLTGSDTDGARDVYVRSGTTTRLVSSGQINGNGAVDAFFAGTTTDGSRVFFQTDEQLSGDDTDARADIYERAGGTTTRVTQGEINGNGNAGAFFAGASEDGSRVFFITNEQLAFSDLDGHPDIYERSSGTTKHVTRGDVNGNGANFVSFGGISKNGGKVFFQTTEQLAADDRDTSQDLYERVDGRTHLISPGGFIAAADASFAGVSDDGSRAFFTTSEPVLRGDNDTNVDVFGAHRAPGAGSPGAGHDLLSRVSTGEINGNTGGLGSFLVGNTPNGLTAFFITPERLTINDADSSNDIYVRRGGVTQLVTRGAVNGNGAFANNFSGSDTQGLFIYFNTAEKLVPGDLDDSIDVYQGSSFGGPPKLVSTGPVNGNGPFGAAFERTSKNGLKMVFSTAEQLVAGDTDSSTDIYQRGLLTDNTTRISAGAVNGNGALSVRFLDASDTLSRVLFQTDEQLVAEDTDLSADVYERASGATTLVSAGEINGNKRFNVFFRNASTDGLRVFFTTAEALVAADTDQERDVYERFGGTTRLVSAGAVNGNGPRGAEYAGASADGTKVFFLSNEQLVADDTDTAEDLYKRTSGTTTRVSVGEINGNAGVGLDFAGVSENGARVFFQTRERLVAADTDGAGDIYERKSGATTLISAGEINGDGPQSAAPSRVSADGSRVIFHTLEQLVPEDTDGNTDVYERASGTTNLITPGDSFASFAGSSDDGSVIFFSTTDATISSDVDATSDAYAAYLAP